MKPATKALRDTLRQDNSIRIKPRLIAEWEYNRFFAPTVTVTPDQSGDDDWKTWNGNIASIVQPNRPRAGIAKARADNGVRPEGPYRDVPTETRYYPSYEYDTYMYWGSKQRSQLTAVNGGYNFDAPIVLTVTYPDTTATNKLVVGFEAGYGLPTQLSIQVSPDGVAWNTISNNPTVSPDGTITLYRGGNGWGTDVYYEFPTVIKAVRVNVYAMSKPYTHLDVLQISPRLENDLTDFLVSYSTSSEVSSPSFIAPLGKASSNTASVKLSNIDGRFSNENTESLYYHMIEKKVRFKLDLGLDTTGHGGTGYEYIREFTMWTDSWTSSDDSSNVTVELKDSSVILQEAQMPPTFLQNTTVGGIVAQVMDRQGMTNYAYTRAEHDYGQIIPFYWPTNVTDSSNPRWGKKIKGQPADGGTIWDEFSGLAEGTQTALYFDQYDVLQIRARKSMYNTGKTVDWNLDAVPNGIKLADVVNAKVNHDLAANQIEVTYHPCSLSDDQNGLPQMATVWQPQAEQDTSIVPKQGDNSGATDIVLRASNLQQDCRTNDTDLWIFQPEAATWPWESDVNIEGEVLHYKGKEYNWYDNGGVEHSEFVTSLDQQQQLDNSSPNWKFKNTYSGRLQITQRGLYGSEVRDHLISNDNYTSLATSYDNKVFMPLTGYVTQGNGYITMTNIANGSEAGTTYHLRKNGSAVPPYVTTNTVWYGMGFRFPSGYTTAAAAPQTQDFTTTVTNPSKPDDHPETATATSNWKLGGLYFAGDWGDAGYFLEITATGQLDGWENRQWRHEICLIAMDGDAPARQITGVNGDNKGFQIGVLEDAWYQLDVSFNSTGDTDSIQVYLNGVPAGTWNLSGAERPRRTNEWRFGTHVRGPSKMDVEYLYAVSWDETNDWRTPDETNFMDLKTGSFVSGWPYEELRYNYKTITPTYQWPYATYTFPQRVDTSKMVFDEFGPVVHEVRKFDVQFDTNTIPAISSFLYLSNSGQVQTLSYQSDVFGAEFMLANASRQNAIVNGSDSITAGADNPISQSILIYGRVVYTAQSDNYLTKKDDDAIRRQGLIRTQFTTRYIQTEDMANEIAEWILSLWATGVDEVEAETFGNPLIQIGDLVTMNYPVLGMYPTTHQYYVVSVKSDYDAGYKTTLTLRRAKVDSSALATTVLS